MSLRNRWFRRGLVRGLALAVITFIPLILLLGARVFLPAEAAPQLLSNDAGQAPQAVVTVTNNNDSGSGSLRNAIALANSGDTINFAANVSGTIPLTSGELVITQDLTINGPGASILSVSGNHASRVFNLTSGSVSIAGLTIKNGSVGSSDNGGGILLNSGALTLTGSTLISNTAQYGGGIDHEDGTLFIANSAFVNNSSVAGGAIDNDGGTLIISATTFLNNTTKGAGAGGAIFTQIPTTIANSLFMSNTALYGGGIDHENGALLIQSSTFSSNSATGGGGIDNDGGTLTISSTTFVSNTAVGGTPSVGGAIWTQIPATIVNSTFSSNSADGGGALHVDADTTSLLNVTFSGNAASSGGGAIQNISGTVTVKNNIIANSPAGGNCNGTMTSNGHNLSSDVSCAGLTATGDLTNTNPLLGALANNGGPTFTQMPRVGSRAIDAGDNSGCPATDQRGIIRPIDGNGDGVAICDMGSVEAPRRLVFLPLVVRQ